MVNQSTLKNKPLETTIVKPPIKDLLVWQAASRPFKKRNKEYFTTIAAVVFLLVIILLFLKEWLLIGVIVSFMFFVYILASVPPQKETYKITTRGVVIADKTYKWQQLDNFWFSKKWDSQILNFSTLLAFPRRLQIVLGDLSKEKVKAVVGKYLTLEKPKASFTDKAADWLVKKFPLESK